MTKNAHNVRGGCLATAVVALISVLLVAMLCFWFFFLVVRQRLSWTPPTTDSLVVTKGEARIRDKGFWVGCKSRKTQTDIEDMAELEDYEASVKVLADAVETGDCLVFENGGKVYVINALIDWRQIRNHGGPEAYWARSLALQPETR